MHEYTCEVWDRIKRNRIKVKEQYRRIKSPPQRWRIKIKQLNLLWRRFLCFILILNWNAACVTFCVLIPQLYMYKWCSVLCSYIIFFLSKFEQCSGLYSVITLFSTTESDNSGRINWEGCRKSAWSSEESSSGLGQDWRTASCSERKELGTCPCKTRNFSCRNFAGMLSTLRVNCV